MKTFVIQIRILLLLLTVFLAQGLNAAIAPVNLKCGAWVNPLGIDDASPRLSWQVVSTLAGERAQSESAYQIQAASSAALLAANQPDLWDSGKVVSTQPFNVIYGGTALSSVQQVFWQVRVWDVHGSASAWSSVATWTMGLLKPTDWQGGWLVPSTNSAASSLNGSSWIWYPEGNPASSAPVGARYFRKTFDVRSDSALTGATLLMTADNSFTAYLNGSLAGQGADYTKVVPLSVTNLLQPGANLMAVAAVNGGTSPNPAGLIGKLVLSYADGTQTNIQLDATWKAANSLQTNWQIPGFDDSSWVAALVLGSYGIGPWGAAVTVQSSLPIFRREFTVNSGLQRAVIFICGLGQYDLYANGAKVGNAVLGPNWSFYSHSCVYDSLDLTPYLTNGDNALGVMLGNGMYNVAPTANYSKFTGSFGPPKVIAQIYLSYSNGTSQVIASDSQWFTSPGPITYSHVYGGESIDARLAQAGWNQAGFNASSWSAASVTSGPGGTLRGQSHAAPPIIPIQTFSPVQIQTFSSSNFVYDMGQNAAMIASLTTHGPAGSIVQIIPSELTNADGTINRNSVGGGTCYWQYTLAGTGAETCNWHFFYHGSRYLQVLLTPPAGSTQLPSVDSLSVVAIRSAAAATGDFSCSNDIFNRTRNITRWAQMNNLISILTDCPTRERLGWLEQYNLHGPSLRYEFDCGLVFAKTMQDMADSQTSTGLMPDIAPEVTVFSGGFRDSPEWGSSCIIVPWQHYLFTGDDSLLRNYYFTMTNYFAYLQKQSVNNFLNYPNGLGEWYDIGPNAPGYSQDSPVSLTADAYFCQDAQILAQAAGELGLTADANRFSALATNIGIAFNSTYYSSANGYYATGSQTAQAFPLYLGIVSPTNQASVLATLVGNINSVGLTSGEIGHRYLLRALTDMGRADVVYTLHSGTNGPGYGDILSHGATALTEAWDANSADSQDHFMLGHITEWFYHDLGGIQMDPSAPGFQHVIIKPALVSGVSWANATYNSVRGPIASAWGITNNVATLNITIPAGATGTVYLPLSGIVLSNLIVQESGTVVWRKGAIVGGDTGVQSGQVQTNASQVYLVWQVGSGNYVFTWNNFTAPTGLQANASNGQVTLSWSADPGASGYKVKRSSTNGSGYVTISGIVTSTNYVDLAVTNNVTDYYVVSALSGGTESANSASVAATPGFLANFGFEAPTIASYQYNPSGAGWTFTPSSGANGSGISGNNSPFTTGNPNAPQGVQVAFLQGISSVSQNVSGLISGAVYQVTFSAAQRNNIYGAQSGQTWQLQVDGKVIGSYSPPQSAQSYTDYTATFTASTAGTHTLAFVTTDANGGDNTIFIDNVRLACLPSVATPQLVIVASPQLNLLDGSGQMQITWPPDHTGWELQVQTNSSPVGLSTNWITLLGSALTNEFLFSMGAADSSVFFRLVYP